MTINGKKTVTALGWVWTVIGAIMVMSGSGGFLVSLLQGDAFKPLKFGSAPWMDWIWAHYRQVAATQVLLAAFIVLTAQMLLRRQRWARIALQGCVLIVLVALIGMNGSMMQMFTSNGRMALPEPVRLMFGAICIASTLFYGLPCLLCLWLLNRREVRAEFRVPPLAT